MSLITNRRPALCLLALATLLIGGCHVDVALDSILGVPTTLLSNLGGWNLSACGGNGFQTCAGLLVDNQQQIFDGRTAEELVHDTAVGFLTSTGSARISSERSPD